MTLLFAALLALAACSDNDITEPVNGDGAISFNCMVGTQTEHTRALADGYVPLPAGYALNIQMQRQNDANVVSPEGTAATYLVNTTGSGEPSAIRANGSGLYWPSNTAKIGFSVSGGQLTSTINDTYHIYTCDQSSAANLIGADVITGFSGTDANHAATQYMTAKDWKTANASSTIPLYLKHEKAEITVILQAGVGVSQSDLAYVENSPSLSDTIYSYDGTNDVRMLPLAEAGTVDGATAANTTQYTAIVEPYNYYANASNAITRISLNNQRYTFSASNDASYLNTDEATQTTLASTYNLQAGEHLTLTIKIGRDGREVLVSAVKEDWKLVVNKDIATDDFGYATQPIVITSVEELKTFLAKADQNMKGNIAILNADLTLGADDAATIYENTLNATLNLNGKTVTTPQTLLRDISASGILKYGIIKISGSGQSCAAVTTNNGTIEDITSKAATGITLAKAGIVETNNANVLGCTNNATVTSDNGTLGGIVATSSSTGKIDGCTNNGKVYTTNAEAHLGGIVGTVSEGTVTNNTYTYGITLNQNVGSSIIGSGTPATASGNAWPTKATDASAGNNNFDSAFDGVVDSDTELANAVTDATATSRYRIASNFTLPSTWNSDNTKTLVCTLDGNNKTVSTSGTQMFGTVTGTFKNVTIELTANLATTSSSTGYGAGTDAISAVCLKLDGGTLDGITVSATSSDITISANNPSGLVGSSSNGATIANCVNNVPLVIYGLNDKTYAGGIVAEAEKTTISCCGMKANISMKVSGKSTYVGAIAGVLNKSGAIGDGKACTVTDCTNYRITLEGYYVGGIVGRAELFGTTNCVGNWWPAQIINSREINGIGSGNGNIGKKNSITPSN
jgi:hypothetical protein